MVTTDKTAVGGLGGGGGGGEDGWGVFSPSLVSVAATLGGD